MNFKSFFYIFMGMTGLGISIGYVIGFYTGKHAINNYWFYLSVPIFIVASFFVVYGALFIKGSK